MCNGGVGGPHAGSQTVVGGRKILVVSTLSALSAMSPLHVFSMHTPMIRMLHDLRPADMYIVPISPAASHAIYCTCHLPPASFGAQCALRVTA